MGRGRAIAGSRTLVWQSFLPYRDNLESKFRVSVRTLSSTCDALSTFDVVMGRHRHLLTILCRASTIPDKVKHHHNSCQR